MTKQHSHEQFAPLPPVAAWQLRGAYTGFEVARFITRKSGVLLKGTTVGVEGDTPWSLRYAIEVDSSWKLRKAVVEKDTGESVHIERDGEGNWTIDGQSRPEFRGYSDLDLEASAVTNTIPVHRLALQAGEHADAPAAYVRTKTLEVESLGQSYECVSADSDGIVFDYRSPRFGYHDRLHFAPNGLIREYPGIGVSMPLSEQ